MDVVELGMSQTILAGSGVDVADVILDEGTADNVDAYALGLENSILDY